MLKPTPIQAKVAAALRDGVVLLRAKGWSRNGTDILTKGSSCMMQAFTNCYGDMPPAAERNAILDAGLIAMGFGSCSDGGLHSAIIWNDTAANAEEVISRMEKAAAKLEEEALCC